MIFFLFFCFQSAFAVTSYQRLLRNDDSISTTQDLPTTNSQAMNNREFKWSEISFNLSQFNKNPLESTKNYISSHPQLQTHGNIQAQLNMLGNMTHLASFIRIVQNPSKDSNAITIGLTSDACVAARALFHIDRRCSDSRGVVYPRHATILLNNFEIEEIRLAAGIHMAQRRRVALYFGASLTCILFILMIILFAMN